MHKMKRASSRWSLLLLLTLSRIDLGASLISTTTQRLPHTLRRTSTIIMTSLAGAKVEPPSSSPTTTTATTTTTSSIPKRATLRVFGPDAKGIVAAFSQLLFSFGCGIVDSEQNTDAHTHIFFQRLHFDYESLLLLGNDNDDTSLENQQAKLEYEIQKVCERFQMQYMLSWNMQRKRVAILVSKYDHCLWELLLRHKAGELDCEISVIVSNHDDLKPIAESFGIPFHVFAITKDTKQEQERRELELLQTQYKVDLVILARYMQIISDDFCNAFPFRVINIHHSFLPAFIGGKPYHRAHARGVKLIGATAHYATAELDEGPIIEQDIARISHRDAVDDLLRKGRLLEKNTLVTAVKAHLEDRIIVYDNKCVVFGQ